MQAYLIRPPTHPCFPSPLLLFDSGRFRWLGSGSGTGPTAVENERTCSFSALDGGAGKELTALENERNCSFSRVGVRLSLCRRRVPCISQMGG